MTQHKHRPGGNTGSRAELLAALLGSIRDSLEAHPPTLVKRAQGYRGDFDTLKWNAQRQEVICEIKGRSAKPYELAIRLADGPRRVAACSCTCPYDDGSGFCKHTFVALRQLEQKLSDPGAALGKAIFGVEPADDWQAAVQAVQQFLQGRQQRRAEESQTGVRIAWRIDFVPGQNATVYVAPYEQRLNDSGQWSRGRRIGWERLAKDPSLWVTEAEQQIGKVLRGLQSAGEQLEPDALDVLEHLPGHPAAFWTERPREAIDIRKSVAGLAVEPEGNGYRLLPAIDELPIVAHGQLVVLSGSDRGALLAVDPKKNQIRVAVVDRDVLHLLQRILKLNPKIPKRHQEQMLQHLAGIEDVLPLALPKKMVGGSVAADRRLILRLTPRDAEGLIAELKVQPTREPQVYDPGEGPAELADTIEGRRVVLRRNPEVEIARGRALVEEVQLHRHPQTRAWRWVVADNEDALDLISAAEARAGDGSGELIVQWPEGVRISVEPELDPQTLRVEISEGRDWFGIEGAIHAFDEELRLEELLDAVRQGDRYVAIGKNKWALIAKSFRDKLAALGDAVQQRGSEMRIHITAAPIVEGLGEGQVTIGASDAWQHVHRRLADASELNPDPPVTLMAELREYQLEGYRWLRRLAAWGVGGCLADDMGLGKTVQTLAALIDRVEEGPALVVAPTSVAFNWVREAQRFAPTLHAVLYRETDRNDFLSSVDDGDVVVISYGLLQRDIKKLAAVEWGTLVLDEAQKIKNSQTKTAQAVRKLEADWRLALTGTPIENHLGELWSIFRAVCPGLFGSWERFRDRFAEPIERRKDSRRRRALSQLLRPFVLRRTKSEVLSELPERTETQLTAELSTEERRMYEETRLRAVAKLSGAIRSGGDKRFEVLAALTRLRQLACHPKLVDPAWPLSSAKLDLLLEIVDELREGNHRALVFSQFTQHLALIRDALDEEGIRYCYLDGSTPAKQRMQQVDAFQRGEGQLFLISLKAGGTGLNLTAADYVIHMDPWWNPAVEDQATDRAHRIGQTRSVTVYRLVAQDTIEEQILALHDDKRNLVAGVLEGTDQTGKLTTEELVELIRAGGRQDLSLSETDSTEDEDRAEQHHQMHKS